VQWLVGSYINPTKAANAAAVATARHNDPIDYYLDGVVVYGSPERVVDEIHRLQEEMFLEYLLCAPLSHASFVLFTEKVLPRLL
jgi:alkanesulfonate monooxygenase SsuD/methylene tetrahydromethanopterin reductase-like flavin-dependent oxidoreductase (luciferase family)